MTQAFNLSQLANNLTSAGLLDAADGLINAVPIANGGTGATTASVARSNLGVAQAVFSVPSGGIIMWSGSIASIPTGWLLCDGTLSTPDLRSRFIVGAGSTYAVAANGGSADAIVVNHTHSATVTDPSHNHSTTSWQGPASAGQGGGGDPGQRLSNNVAVTSSNSTTGISVSINATGSSGTNANLPPYYALAFIMKS